MEDEFPAMVREFENAEKERDLLERIRQGDPRALLHGSVLRYDSPTEPIAE
jgi:hypothetical protein